MSENLGLMLANISRSSKLSKMILMFPVNYW